MKELYEKDIFLPVRRPDTHKGDYGKCLITAGSVGYTGAASMAAHAAVRAGAGLVFLGVPEPIYVIEAVKNDEAIVFPLPSEGGKLGKKAAEELLERLQSCDAALVGPGLGRSEAVTETVFALLRASTVPLILDADGINAAAAHIDILREAQCPLILTPHEGEFMRLGGDVSAFGREEAAARFAREYGCILVLKGHRTITAFPDGETFLNTTGNAGMAKGGSGDVLAGILTALVGQGLPLNKAVPYAVWLHGRAGDIAAAARGEYSMTPCDMIGALGEAMKPVVRWREE
ncbi:MAG: NAD(P)H-hydrate dehydratase [Oscillospiraceae bacterium]|nr:NAD(P)H-hydrate dehydratase [Oscillospiraceae bacterium]